MIPDFETPYDYLIEYNTEYGIFSERSPHRTYTKLFFDLKPYFLNNVNIPTVKAYYADTGITCTEFYLMDDGRIFHRENGPSSITYHTNGKKAQISYHKNGYLHREDGPALIGYDENGNYTHIWYYRKNENYYGWCMDSILKLNLDLDDSKWTLNQKLLLDYFNKLDEKP